MPSAPELATRLFKTSKAWEAWLQKHWDRSPGLWLRIAKKDATLRSITYQEALDVALCHGWIDGIRKRLDEASFVQRFTPRQARSIWSKINRDKVLLLIEQGRVGPGGHASIERARANGQWDRAYDSYRTIQVPDDLTQRLQRNRKAAAQFERLSRQNRYAILFRLHTASSVATREARLREYVAMLARGETLHPQ